MLGAPLVAGFLVVPAAPVQATGPGKTPSGSRTVTVSLDTLAPAAPVEGDTLTVSGTLTNKGKQTITDGEVDLRVGPRLSSRSAIDDAADRTGYLPGPDPARLGGKYTVKIPELRTGGSHDFTLAVPVAKLGLDKKGVYQLGVSVTGQTSRAPYDQVLGIQRTFLPWQPEDSDGKTGLTFLWPLIAQSHMTAETGSDEQQTPVFSDDDLALELAPGGRLEQLVSLGRELPVTWVIDPDLLASVDAMTEPYRVRSGKTTVPGTNQAIAKQWLTALETAGEGRQGGCPAVRRPRPRLHRAPRQERLGHPEPSADRDRGGGKDGGDDPSCEAVHRFRLAGGRCDRSVHRRRRHLGRRPPGDRQERQS